MRTPLERAAIRHVARTPEQVADIRQRWEQRQMERFPDVSDKLKRATTPRSQSSFVAFEPFSPIIISQVERLRTRAERNKLYESILNDERATTLFDTGKAKTTLFPGNRGKGSVWEETKKMAKHLNDNGVSVSFLPEYSVMSSADAIVQFRNRWVIADFKYSTSAKHNTIAMTLHEGFRQSDTIVLKMDNGDSGTFTRAIEQLKRNNCRMGNIILLNRYGRAFEIERSKLLNGKYQKMIKGKL